MLKHTLRSLRRSPAFASIAILSVALAIAVNTSLFAFVDALVNPFDPYVNADRVFSTYTIGGDRRRPIPTDATERALRQGLQSADETASFITFGAMLGGNATSADGLVLAASPNLFELLGVHPEVGRSLAGADAAEDGAVISYTLWNQWFQRRPIDGLKLTIGSQTFRVIGVMPRGVHFPLLTSAWIPMTALPPEIRRDSPDLEVAFRLRAGANAETARRDLNAALDQLAKAYGQNASPGAVLVPLHERSLPFAGYRVTLAVAALVLIIACANLGTMLLARGFARRREVAIRIALGASRRAIWAEVLAECGVLTVAGAALGMLLTLWAMDMLPHLVAGQLPILGDVSPRPSWRTFAFISLACAAFVVFAGWLPAARAARMDPSEAMKDGGATTRRMRDRYNPLLIVEVALSVGLLTTAGLYAQFSLRLASFHFAYDANRLVTAHLKLPASNVAPAAVPQFYADAVVRLKNLPRAEEAATRYFTSADHGVITAESGAAGDRWINLSRVTVVSPEYLTTVGIHVVQGRDFNPGDQTGAAGVVVVDELAARMLWPNDSNTTGHQLKLGAAESRAPWLRVVGVAQRTELEPRADPDLPPEPEVYVVLPNDLTSSREIIVRGEGGGRATQSALALSIRQEVQVFAPWMGGAHVAPWLDTYDRSVSSTAFLATAFTAFGAFGLTLCAVGFFGVIAYAVHRRSREFALCVALGAPTSRIVRAVIHDAAVMVVGGAGLGGIGTLWATRTLRDTLSSAGYQLPVALVAAECVLLVAAVVACYRPLIRATRADPVEILRAT